MDHLLSIPSSAFELILTLPFPLSPMTSLQSCFPLKYISEQFLFINLYTSHFWKITKPQDFFLIPHLSHSFSVSSAKCCQPSPRHDLIFPSFTHSTSRVLHCFLYQMASSIGSIIWEPACAAKLSLVLPQFIPPFSDQQPGLCTSSLLDYFSFPKRRGQALELDGPG